MQDYIRTQSGSAVSLHALVSSFSLQADYPETLLTSIENQRSPEQPSTRIHYNPYYSKHSHDRQQPQWLETSTAVAEKPKDHQTHEALHESSWDTGEYPNDFRFGFDICCPALE